MKAGTTRSKSHLRLPPVIDPGDVLLLPRLEVEHVHPVGPPAGARVEVVPYLGVAEVEVLVEAVETGPARLHGPIHIAFEVLFPQPGEVPLDHDVVIQEEDLKDRTARCGWDRGGPCAS